MWDKNTYGPCLIFLLLMFWSGRLSVAERRASQDNINNVDLIMIHYDMPGVTPVTLYYSGLWCCVTVMSSPQSDLYWLAVVPLPTDSSLETGPANNILRISYATELHHYGYGYIRMWGCQVVCQIMRLWGCEVMMGRQCIKTLQCSPRLINILLLRRQWNTHSLFPL